MKLIHALALTTALSTLIVGRAEAQTASDVPPAAQTADTDAAIGTADVIVTAQKRAERLIDVPVSVTRIDSDALVSQNLVTLRDFYTRVPGLQYTGGAGQTTLAIRGVNTDVGGNPTVGITIDDVPFGSSSSNANGGQLSPDLDPGILQNIEVLRGPQGTLYGASSLGGLLKYETVTPDTNRFSGRIESGAEFVLDGGEGWSSRGSLNVPLISDHVGVSLSGFYRKAPGYIDYTALQSGDGVDANYNRSYGGRAAVLIKPVDAVQINLAFLDQELHGQGGTQIGVDSNFNPLNGFNVNNYSQTLPLYYTRNRLYSGRVDIDFNFATLSSITGYGQTRYNLSNDLTYLFGGLLGIINQVLGLPVAGDRAQLDETFSTNRFSQEVRLASRTGNRFEWLLGAFYNRETSNSNQILTAISRTDGSQTNIFASPSPSTYREIAGFADATYHFTDRLSLQGGVRYADNRQTYTTTGSGPLALLEGSTDANSRSSDHSWTWLVSPQYKLSDSLNLYARVATGYRPGGPNSGLTPDHLSYGPDRTTNYEAGIKGSVLEHKLTFSADAFWIDWRNIQVISVDPTTEIDYTQNGGRARSRGAEVELSYNIWHGGVISANGAFVDAKLRDDLVGTTVGNAGDRLPLSSKWSGNLAGDQSFDLAPDLKATLGATVTYVGPCYSEFATEGNPRGYARGYTTLDLRAGVQSHGVAFQLYAHNVTDRHGIVTVYTDGDPYQASIIQPRTVGGLLSFSF